MDRRYNTTKEPMHFSSYRLPKRDADLVTFACRVRGISKSQFLREALRDKALRVVSEGQSEKTV